MGLDRQCDVYWAHQSRHVERWRGADFGIARRASVDGALCISLYQAKVVREGNKADIFRRIHSDNRSFADRSLQDLLKRKSNLNLPAEKLHQIHKLFRTRCVGLKETGHDLEVVGLPEWVRYVFWFTSETADQPLPAPSVRSVPSLLEDMQPKREKSRGPRFYPSDFLLDPWPNSEINRSSSDFGSDFIALASDGGASDLFVTPDMARDLLGELAKIGIPDFLVADEVGGDDGEDFWQDVFGLTNLNVTFKTGTRDMGTRPTSAPSLIPRG